MTILGDPQGLLDRLERRLSYPHSAGMGERELLQDCRDALARVSVPTESPKLKAIEYWLKEYTPETEEYLTMDGYRQAVKDHQAALAELAALAVGVAPPPQEKT